MVEIRNKAHLVKNGRTEQDRKARKLALDSLEKAIDAANPTQIIKSRLKVDNSILRVDNYSFDLREFNRIYVIGGGKASGSMAEALEQILGDRIKAGLVNVPRGDKSRTRIIKIHETSHPIPDQTGVDGTRQMLQMASQTQKTDLVVCLISGGGSSLMPLPRGSIRIDDKRILTDRLLKSGATISEINAVRKHISEFKGGWLAKKAYPATILNLVLSDVVGDPLDSIASGPTVPDSTTFADAVRVLKKYALFESAPDSIRKTLEDGERGAIPETPKTSDEAFRNVYSAIIGNNRTASIAACKYLRSKRLNVILLTTAMEGEAKFVGNMLSSIAREINLSGNPVSKPAAVVVGGETTVIVTGKGRGGRNQEISLSAARGLCSLEGVVIASISTDGIDGPTDAAGSVVDGKTFVRAMEEDLSSEIALRENDSYNFFSRLDDLVFTEPTGTNVNDISVIVAL